MLFRYIDKNKTINIDRKIYSRIFQIILLLILLPSMVYGKDTSNSFPSLPPDIRFKHISLDQGLSQASVICIYQDRRGFMWFGTQDGLNMYNGYEFTVFKPNSRNSRSISHITITAITEDRNGFIWIGTQGGGLNRFDRNTQTFTCFRNKTTSPTSLDNDYIRFIHEDQTGHLWIGTRSGLNLFNPNSRTFTRIIDTGKLSGLPEYRGYSIFEDHLHSIWIGTESGSLLQYDSKNQKFSSFPIIPNSPQNNITVQAIYEDVYGNLWIGTSPCGLYKFNRSNGSFTPFMYNSSIPLSLSFPTGCSAINTITGNSNGDLWIGTNGSGLYKLDQKNGNLYLYTNNLNGSGSLSNNYVLSLYIDHSDILWVGTLGGGLNQYPYLKERFSFYHAIPNEPNSLNNNVVRAILEDQTGNLWIGTMGGGLTQINRKRNKYTHYLSSPSDKFSLKSNSVRTLYQDNLGYLWIGTEDAGLDLLTQKNGKTVFIHFQNNPKDPSSLSSNTVTSIVKDLSGTLWVGTSDSGLNRYNPSTKNFTHFQHDPTNPNSISNNTIYCLFLDPLGQLWIGTASGFNRLIPSSTQSPTFISYKSSDTNRDNRKNQYETTNPDNLNKNSILTIHHDTSGIFWLGTRGGGLLRFDPKTQTFNTFSEADGLPNNVIYGILEDNNGCLWLSSNKGISKFNKSDHTTRNYDYSDGLQSNEFNSGAYFKNKKGELFFGGVNGLNSFFPDQIKDNPYIPPIVITDFKIFNQSVIPSSSYNYLPNTGPSPLEKSITETKKIVLDHQQLVISFEFSALNYINPSKNKYAYMLEGFDKNWIYCGTRRFATYTNLNPGKYKFKVKGSNNDGIWNTRGTDIEVVILPPFWKSTPAYIFYTLIFAGLLLGIRRFEMNRERAKVKLWETELRSMAMAAEARAIKAENERQTLELEEARKFQLSMLPEEIPKYLDYEIAVYMETASEVGGDYYDFHVNESNSLSVIVGDATGHGLKAATMVSVIKGLFCADEDQLNMESFFRKVSHTIQHMHLKNLYMALVLMDIKEDRLKFTSAGMPPIYIYRYQEQKLENIRLKGTPLGAFNHHSDYSFYESILNPGDTLLIMSDGLPELFDNDDEMFDYERIEQIFKENAHLLPQEIIDRLVEEGKNWINGSNQDDDITLIVIQKLKPCE